MRKIAITTMLIIGLTINSFSQNLKTFSGEFDNGEVTKGNAVFTYYEDSKSLEYIKHGLFKYSRTVQGDYGNYTENINGNYKNGKKDGLWTYIISETDYPSHNTYYSGSIKLTSNYSNGKPNGSWIYNCQLQHRDKTVRGWTLPKVDKPEIVNATFKNGVLVGPITFVNNPTYAEYNNITGQLTQGGYLTGKWSLKSSGYEETMELKNGILCNWVVREIKTGKVTDQEIDDQEMTKIKDDFSQGKLKVEDLKALSIKIDTINASTNSDQNGYYDFLTSFNLGIFYPRYITGDETYYYESDWVDLRNYGKYLKFTKVGKKQLDDIPEYEEAAKEMNRGNGCDAKEMFEAILEKYKMDLSNNDKKTINENIIQSKKWCH